METLKILGIAFGLLMVGFRFYKAYGQYKERQSLVNIPPKKKREPSAKEYTRIEVAKTYSVALPSQMEPTTELNDEAALQYQDGDKDLYVIGIDEPVSEFVALHREYDTYDEGQSLLDNYKRVQWQTFTEGMQVSRKTEDFEQLSQGSTAYTLTFEAKLQGILVPIFYVMRLVEINQKLIYLIAWTTAYKRKGNEATLKKILASFRPLNNSSTL